MPSTPSKASNLQSLWLGLGVLAAIGVGTWGFGQLVSTAEPGARGSTFSRNTHGAAGLFALAEALDLQPGRQRTAWVDPPSEEIAQIWMLTPAAPLGEEEIAQLETWVAGGGTLVFADQRAQSGGAWESLMGRASTYREEVPPEVATAMRPLTEATGELEVPARRGIPVMSLDALPSRLDHPLTIGIDALPALPHAVGQDWELPVLTLPRENQIGSGFSVLWSTPVGPVVAERSLGAGRIVYCTQPAWFGNALIAKPGFTEFAAALLRYRTRPGSVQFSEYHHGHRESLRGVSDLLAVGWGQAFLWSALVLVLAIVSAGWRFVAIPEAAAARAPDPSEYAAALGRLYHRAGVWENIHYNLAVFYRRIATEGPSARRADVGSLARQRRAERLAKQLGSLNRADESPRGLLRILGTDHPDDHPVR